VVPDPFAERDAGGPRTVLLCAVCPTRAVGRDEERDSGAAVSVRARQVVRARTQFDRQLRVLSNQLLWDDTPANVRYVISVRDDPEQPTLMRLRAADMLMSRTVPTLQAARVSHEVLAVGQGQVDSFDWPAAFERVMKVIGPRQLETNGSDRRIH